MWLERGTNAREQQVFVRDDDEHQKAPPTTTLDADRRQQYLCKLVEAVKLLMVMME